MPEHADVIFSGGAVYTAGPQAEIADNRVLATYMQGEAVYRTPALG